jgi:uncharacterized repeat protein (TIGR03806 family)
VKRGLIALLCCVIAGCGGGGSGGSNIGTNFRVPDVVGETQANAGAAIVAAGLTVGTISTSTSATVAAGSVISQSPAAGSSVAPNTAVNLVVSTGASATVPNVVGQTQGTATSMIAAGGLVAGTVTQVANSTVPTGRVISQNPTGGAVAAAGSSVSLTVSAYPAGFGIGTRPALAAFTLPTSGGGGSGVFDAVEAFPNLSLGDALIMTGIPGETRLVVANQSGKVLAFAPSAGVSTTRTIVDLASKIVAGGEQGLLGLAMDPNFATNRYFYVDYTRQSDGATVIARYTWVGGATDAASLSSEKVILVIPQPMANHNGGMIAFGPDGYLYIAMGDGGGSNDQFGNAQNMAALLGKILRIDVHPANDATPYNVPADNPFVNRSGARGEIWALGLRNPFRFSFDRGGSGQLWAGDVGQDQTEEIDIITKGGNYGWPRFEGSTLYQSGTVLASGTTHTPPIYEYDHPHGFSVIGGYVYRGTQIASLIGKYLYSDYFNGIVSSLGYDGTNPATNTDLATVPSPAGFGEDNNGEVYIVSQTDGLFQLTETGGGGSGPALLSQTGLFTNLATLTPAAGLIEYDLNMPFWSDGALKRRWVAVPANLKVTFSSTGSWTFPVGTVIVKHFEMEMIDGDPNSARRLETRILTRTSTGWEGFTYRWNAGETDADLLATGATEVLTINAGTGSQRTQTYDYPSRTDCLQCHTSAAGFALGLSTRQLNKDFDYGAVTDNELRTLDHIGYFSSSIGTASQYGAYPAIDDTSFSVATRARAYLAVNCAQCHRPGGPTNVNLDFRFDTADASMNAIDVTPTQGDLGIGSAARIIAPGAKANSVLWQRMQRLDGTRMPPLASHRVDQTAVTVIGSWIDGL